MTPVVLPCCAAELNLEKKINKYKIDCPRANRSAWIIVISLVLKCPLSNVHPVYHINNTLSNKLIDKLIIDLAATQRSSAGFAWRRAAVDEPCWRRQRTPRHPGNDPWITSRHANSKIRCNKEVKTNGGAQDLSNPMSATIQTSYISGQRGRIRKVWFQIS